MRGGFNKKSNRIRNSNTSYHLMANSEYLFSIQEFDNHYIDHTGSEHKKFFDGEQWYTLFYYKSNDPTDPGEDG